jgi:L-malate glycosyltransferase
MTILLLTHSYPDENNRWRGLFIKEQAGVLAKEHLVIVVYFKVDNSRFAPFSKYSFTKVKDNNLILYTLTTPRSFPVINQFKYLHSTFRFILNKIVPENKIDLVHSHLSYPAGFLGVFVGKKLKVPALLNEHSWLTNYFRSMVHRQCALYAINKSDAVVAVSNALRENIHIFNKREINVVPNVIDVDKFIVSGEKKPDGFNIGLLGGMGTRIKGVDILLQAVSMIRKVNVKAHIGGAGKYLDEYRQMAKDLGIDEKCLFYGEITSETKAEFYSRMDIYIMASRRETFGVVVVEALASGIPVISTRCGGPEEIITKETGLLIEKENPAELARAIESISEKMDLFDRQAIRKYAVDYYGQHAFMKRITDVYKSLTSQAGKGDLLD